MSNTEVKKIEQKLREVYSAIYREQAEAKRVSNLLNQEWYNQQEAFFKEQRIVNEQLRKIMI
ncbi:MULTISPECIES: hypothetical protein [Acinetobacter calcoaceticus/baumannii complex]|uniref:hypothetical protein n=1 Tax=Acinetobacter calcoaceticus/baumannii complex TaxID=909768 RepID=UPI00062A8731|nr:hypothetical protein [Acinetobacter pittii]MDC4368338.1 hypothetical protein [Acinetobacter baumannii]MDC5191876.1 hypothetical protein [Acinetobacter baumannii]MDC5568785.1 hypothetical protein [Acinetobacter baumannii]MDO7202066.1 hypothetical protein [Acinetobacter baumannii]TGU90816.1 hypothetical protein YA64_001395 [Acinetobacter pittii]